MARRAGVACGCVWVWAVSGAWRGPFALWCPRRLAAALSREAAPGSPRVYRATNDPDRMSLKSHFAPHTPQLQRPSCHRLESGSVSERARSRSRRLRTPLSRPEEQCRRQRHRHAERCRAVRTPRVFDRKGAPATSSATPVHLPPLPLLVSVDVSTTARPDDRPAFGDLALPDGEAQRVGEACIRA